MPNKSAHQFQLEQVQRLILAGQDDPTLRQLEAKLKRLVELHDVIEPVGGGGSRERRGVMEEGGKGDVLEPGRACEARRPEDGMWYEATVQSYSSERKEYTVCARSSPLTFHCPQSDVRPWDARRKQASTSRKPSKPSYGRSDRREKAPPDAKRRPKTTKAEYVQRKEEEQSHRQAGWKSFAEKVGITKRR